MRNWMTLPLCLLLAGCTAAAPAPSAAPQSAQTLAAVLDGCIAFEADSAGGSLKTAVAASGLVVFLADGPDADLPGETQAWQQDLTADEQQTLDANWPGVYRCAQELCADPAAQRDLLDTAGVTTDFTALDLTGVPQDLDTIDRALYGAHGQAAPGAGKTA